MSAYASELHPFVDPNAERVCVGCGCTEFTPCVDEATGEACAWMADADMDICSFCAAIAMSMAEADEADVAAQSSRVEVYSPHEAQQFIESRRAKAKGAGQR